MSSFFTQLTVNVVILASVSWAQLLSGDAVGFFGGECKVGNTTMVELGISEFNKTIAPQPLTWTIGTERVDNDAKKQSLYVRSYFLGTPSSLQLANSSTVRFCALFFLGVSSSLSFPGNLSKEYTDGTCGDALGASCTIDLISESQYEMGNLLGTAGQNFTEPFICAALETKLQNNVPESCQIAHSKGWGTIIVRSLAGPEAVPIS